ncbi:OsmC family protein [Agrobacterium vitis]|uniref:OsmC family protein n=1 Tax=Agrobacterium vitis TaxID=373 RepID=UPI0008730BC5|nr:OsmC family protein [Agrobacterium vitis]MCE6074952.1 OsmC family peroxiredoxin [Agrobacterium vitis]MCM2452295.1 OsmC family protein [Agrobacterium vitis]MCM2467643.1 OsmC family protein [Agrobacterium vitis]MUO68452.1 OsmC family peroxiredoxin [Agrobacterium vitis]MUO83330.1 OsmC family peroxiredoxin [Agrobacterium vitis]
MAEIKMRARPMGATAVIGRTGFPQITSATGGELAIVTGPSQPGFNPLDLLYASLAGCLTISARLAASEMGVMDKITSITASVTGEKAKDGLSRVARLDITLTIQGDIDAETRKAIADRAEHEICTVSNTLSGSPEFVTTVLD